MESSALSTKNWFFVPATKYPLVDSISASLSKNCPIFNRPAEELPKTSTKAPDYLKIQLQ